MIGTSLDGFPRALSLVPEDPDHVADQDDHRPKSDAGKQCESYGRQLAHVITLLEFWSGSPILPLHGGPRGRTDHPLGFEGPRKGEETSVPARRETVRSPMQT